VKKISPIEKGATTLGMGQHMNSLIIGRTESSRDSEYCFSFSSMITLSVISHRRKHEPRKKGIQTLKPR
jgi:hypothetical protein